MINSEDILIKQIKAISKIIAKILLQKEDFVYVLPKSEADYNDYDKTFSQIMLLVEQNNFDDAEDLLFTHLYSRDVKMLQIALTFYDVLLGKPETLLKENDFSLEEVEQGFFDVLKLYNNKADRR